MATYTIHGGHGYPGKGAIGVVGYINESIQDRIVANKVKEYLEIDGNKVHNITIDNGNQNAILSALVKAANGVAADLNISIHFNAANGSAYGTEVWIKNGDNRARAAAQRIVDNIVALGFRNRGVKTSNDLYILNKMKNPTLLVECCFADNLNDFNLYDADKMAYAIANGIVGHTINIPTPIKHTVELVRPEKDCPVYRLYNSNTGEHFYTGLIIESDTLIDAGWTFEGIAWYSSPNTQIPVYRLYNQNNGDHFYTLSDAEVLFLTKVGWTFENISWYSNPEETIPVYRLYNPNITGAGSHHYTINNAEKDILINDGWICEGISWFGA